jgi:DDE superfamily endonuclease
MFSLNYFYFRSTGERFNLAKSTLSVGFFRTVNLICSMSSDIIKWPSEAEIPIVAEQFRTKSKIPNIIGAVDGTYCKIEAPKMDSVAYLNRKCFHSVTLQAICDPQLKYTDCFVGYPSSVHDIRIFRNSDIYKPVINRSSSHFPDNHFIIGDKAYPSLMTCVVPFRETGRLTQQQKSFNFHHAKARQVIERSFALLFGRFQRLKHLKMQNIKMVPKVILAACVLHNICLEFDGNIEQYMREGLELVRDNGDISTPFSAYAQQENSSEAITFRQRLCDDLSLIIN